VARAHAAKAQVDFSVDFEPAPACPSEADFVAALHARQPLANRVSINVRAAHIHVRLAASSESGDRSEIVIELPDGTSLRRELPPSSCSDAVSSMALIAAMALEDNLDASAVPSEQSASESPSGAVSPRPASTPPAQRSTPQSTPPARTSGGVANKRARWRWELSARAGVKGGVAPELAPAVDVGVGVELALPRASALTPTVRVSGLVAQRTGDLLSVPGAQTTFRLLAVRGELCPRGLDYASLATTLCAIAEYGALHGSAKDVAQPHEQSMSWLGAGLAVRGRLELSGVLSIEVASSARALAVHNRFVLSPSVLVYQVPRIAGDFLLGLNVTWR
jgi:hypothetical protein